MAADEVTARRRFRQRLDAIGEQYPTLKTPEAQERLTRELARQAKEEGEVAEDIKRGRPRGKMAETIELKTVSFKLTPALLTRVQKYAKEHRLTFSELVREGLEARLEQEDPLDYRYRVQKGSVSPSSCNTGNTDSEAVERIEGMLQGMQAVITQQGEQIQALVQALERQTTSPSNGAYYGNTDKAPERQENPASQEPGGREQDPVPDFDTTRYFLGKLCRNRHNYQGTGQSLLHLSKDHPCVECKRARTQRWREKGATK